MSDNTYFAILGALVVGGLMTVTGLAISASKFSDTTRANSYIECIKVGHKPLDCKAGNP